MSDQDVAMLSDMFAGVDVGIIRMILEECGGVEPAINKLLEMTDPSYKPEEGAVARTVVAADTSNSTSASPTSPNALVGAVGLSGGGAGGDDALSQDAQMAYALQMQMNEEDEARRREEEEGGTLEDIGDKVVKTIEATSRKAKEWFGKLTHRVAGGEDHNEGATVPLKEQQQQNDNNDAAYLYKVESTETSPVLGARQPLGVNTQQQQQQQQPNKEATSPFQESVSSTDYWNSASSSTVAKK